MRWSSSAVSADTSRSQSAPPSAVRLVPPRAWAAPCLRALRVPARFALPPAAAAAAPSQPSTEAPGSGPAGSPVRAPGLGLKPSPLLLLLDWPPWLLSSVLSGMGSASGALGSFPVLRHVASLPGEPTALAALTVALLRGGAARTLVTGPSRHPAPGRAASWVAGGGCAPRARRLARRPRPGSGSGSGCAAGDCVGRGMAASAAVTWPRRLAFAARSALTSSTAARAASARAAAAECALAHQGRRRSSMHDACMPDRWSQRSSMHAAVHAEASPHGCAVCRSDLRHIVLSADQCQDTSSC